jgi:hypothetical protein
VAYRAGVGRCQVSRKAASIPTHRVHIPGALVDHVVLTAPELHRQTFAPRRADATLTGATLPFVILVWITDQVRGQYMVVSAFTADTCMGLVVLRRCCWRRRGGGGLGGDRRDQSTGGGDAGDAADGCEAHHGPSCNVRAHSPRVTG